MVYIIEISHKISRPRVKTSFQLEPTYSDADEGHFICPELDHTVLKLKNWEPGKRTGKLIFSNASDFNILNNVKFDYNISPSVKQTIVTLI